MEETEDKKQEIKEQYEELSKTYDLPEFNGLADDFDIEKIVEKPTSYLLREIRRAIHEKLSAYMHLLETLINPTSPPLFIYSILKNSTEKDKQEIREIYQELAKIQIECLKLDTIYDEKKEAEFIKDSYKKWQKSKKKAYKIFEEFGEKVEKNHRGGAATYFG